MTTRRSKSPLRVAALGAVALLAAAVALSSVSCKRDGDIIPEGDMVDLMAEMAIAEAYRDAGVGHLPDSVRRNIGEGILAEHGYTYSQLDSTLNWYGLHLDKYYKLYDKVDKEIASRQRKLAKASGGEVGNDNGENIWPYADHFWLSPLGNTDGMHFTVAGSSLIKGESLEWKMRLNNSANVKAFLGVEYTDGTVSFANSGSYGERRLKVDLITDTAKQAKRIIGILQADRTAMPVWADSVQLNKQPYDSTIYYRIRSQKTY